MARVGWEGRVRHLGGKGIISFSDFFMEQGKRKKRVAWQEGVYTEFCISGSFWYVYNFMLLEVFCGVMEVWMATCLDVFFICVEGL